MILNGANIAKHAGLILIDFQKIFDALYHKILFDKMKCIRFSDKIIKSFCSYLTK